MCRLRDKRSKVRRLLLTVPALTLGVATSAIAAEVAPMERIFGATYIHGAVGNGGLTAAFSEKGEMTVLRWPSPGDPDHLAFLTSNAADARNRPRCGAHEHMGLYAGLMLDGGNGDQTAEPSWLHLSPWKTESFYAGEKPRCRIAGPLRQAVNAPLSSAYLTVATNDEAGLRLLQEAFVTPDADALVMTWTVARLSQAPSGQAPRRLPTHLCVYANLSPCLRQIPLIFAADWALDFENDLACAWDGEGLVWCRCDLPNGRPDTKLIAPLATRTGIAASDVSQWLDSKAVAGARGAWFVIQPSSAQRVTSYCGTSRAPMVEASRQIIANCSGEGMGAVLAGMRLLALRFRSPWPKAYARPLSAHEWAERGAPGSVQSVFAPGDGDAALVLPLEHGEDTLSASIRISAGHTLEEARAAMPKPDSAALRKHHDDWWRSVFEKTRLPNTDDPDVIAFSRRAVQSLINGYCNRSGAMVASVSAQPPYAVNWPRDGVFFDEGLLQAGFPERGLDNALFFARVQRTRDETEAPAGGWEMNYYASGVPAGPLRFEIDQVGLTVWWLCKAKRLQLPNGRPTTEEKAQLQKAIDLAVDLMIQFKDPETGLQGYATEDDNPGPPTRGLQGAATTYIGLKYALRLGEDEEWDAERLDSIRARLEELDGAIKTVFLKDKPHFGKWGAPAWMIWPAGFFPPDDSHLKPQAEALLDSLRWIEKPDGRLSSYDGKAACAVAHAFKGTDRIHEVRRIIATAIRTMPTPGTRHLGEVYRSHKTPLPDGRLFEQMVAVPHIWQSTLWYLAALEAWE